MSKKTIEVNKATEVLKALKALGVYTEESLDQNNLQETMEKLKNFFQKISKRENFKSGDIVTWKEGMKNRKLPRENDPAIVIEQLLEPVFDTEKSSGSSYFQEPLDLVAGVIGEDGEFLIFYYDSRRFTKF